MVLKKLLGSTATRSLTVFSVLADAKRAFEQGNHARGALMLGVAVLAWKWAIIGMAAQGIVKLLRKGGSSAAKAT
ncbi:hypothetical protein CV102_04290 [Natronococcus pandeyae]|uniref:Uncharacterized protein n=1 Tax=Natronococcus pandeyae TaxID=2055836 RepID=A0A8J8Q646_9EURY|nr:hypothetical protein [Natronococcus pandeyae]TYL39522.1 hypothetical protein CV102_04290 [Natronococcus pandeyae]